MPRVIAGHGSVSTKKPPPPSGTGSPSLSTTSAPTPGSGRVADPGFVSVTPGSGLIMIAPVSVCHHVSTTGQRSPPKFARYHIQASGLIGSPTDPSRRNDDRSCAAGTSSPHFMNVRIVVGAVYKMLILYFSIISNQRCSFGVFGVPSYMNDVVRFASGPYTMYEWPVIQPISAPHQYRSSSGFRSKTAWCVH